MARNGTGTHSIPNTFVSGNTITASGHNQNWTDVSAEITNSVAADGQTSMTGALKASNGTVAAPSITFASDTDSGWYRKAANSIALSLEGVDRVVYSTATASFAGALTVAGAAVFAGTGAFTSVIYAGNGAVGAPGHTFINEPDCGAYVIGTNNIGYAVAGAKVLDIATTGLAVTGALSTTTSVTVGNGLTVTTGGLTVSAGTVSFPAGSITVASVPNGFTVDRAFASYTATTSITNSIPYDNTIPQVGEGDEILSAAITPKSTTNRIRIRFQGSASTNTSANAVVAAFVNGGADAVVASASTVNADTLPLILEWEYVPGSVAAQTVTIRAGVTGGTMKFNSEAGANARFNGKSAATLVLEEIKAA